MSPEGVILATGAAGGADGQNNIYEVRDPTPAEFDHWLETGRFMDDTREVPTNMSAVAAAGLAHANGVSTAGWPDWLEYIGLYQHYYPGMTLRPFHPKPAGHAAIAKTVIQQIKRDFKKRPIINKYSVQIVFPTHEGQLAWFAFQGPQGIKVNSCRPSDDGFTTRIFYQKDDRPYLAIKSTPYVVATNWAFIMDSPGSCGFIPESDGPGMVTCSDGYVLDFKENASWDDGVFECDGWADGTYQWHRAWTTEWYPRPEHS